MRRCAVIFALLCAACFAGPVAVAAPAGVTRVLRTFDFEERRLGNNEDLPMHWIKIEGAGFPHYVNGHLSTDRAHSGKYSFRFDLNGGGLAYRYPSGLIAVQPGAHYRIEGLVQTTVLPNARARISAFLADGDGHPLAATRRSSELYAARAAGEGWKQLGLDLSADDPKAAYLVLELELLQPAQYAATTLGERALFPQDIWGSAWFDDITVSQVPRVGVATAHSANVFRRDEPLRLQVTIEDRFLDDLAAHLEVIDADGRKVYQRSGALAAASARQIASAQQTVELLLPDLPPGWYRASLGMSSQGQSLGTHAIDFIRLPNDAQSARPDPRFGVDATALPYDGWSELPRLLPLLCAGRVKLALWSSAGDIRQLDGDAFDRLLEQLADLNIAPTACLLDPPPDIAKKLNGNGWPDLLRADPADWQPRLALLISRHANHLDRWQLGADGSDAFATDPRMRKVYKMVYQQFAGLMNQPDLAMPWPAWYELSGDLPATVALRVPTSVLPQQLPLYMQELAGHPGHNLSLSFEPLDRARYGRMAQIKDLAERMIHALAAGATRIDFPLPFTISHDGQQIVKQPRELLMIERTLTGTLSGAVYKGKVPIAEGIEAFLFDRDGQGILALWDRGTEAGVKTLSINLGKEPVSVDLWGNVTPLLRARGEENSGKVQLTVGPVPMFLIDIDAQQSQLRASLGFDRPLLESSFQAHTRRLHFVNTYRNVISGMLKLKAPPGWTLNPPTFSFSLNPGETFDREVQISFPYNSFAGKKTVQCEFAFQADGDVAFAVPTTLNLGLSDVGMESMALRDGKDVIVQQMVSNYGDKPINYSGFAIFPGEARQERLISNLGPGRTVLKRYRFRNVRIRPGVKVRLGLRELEGTRVLNDDVPVQ